MSTAAVKRIIRVFKDLSSLFSLRSRCRKVCPAVHLVARFALIAAKGPLFTVAYDVYAIRCHTLTYQEFFNGVCPAIAKAKIVFFAAAFVTMSFDGEPDVWVGLQPTGIGLKNDEHVSSDFRTIIVKENVLDVVAQRATGHVRPRGRVIRRRCGRDVYPP